MTGTTGDGAHRDIPGQNHGAGCDDTQLAQSAGAYLLGALDDAEAEEFRQHLRRCPACAAQVEQLRPVVAMLGTVSEHDLQVAWAPDPARSAVPPVTDGPAGASVTGIPAGVPGDVVGGAPAGTFAGGSEAGPVPDTLLPGLLAAANRHRRDHRRLVTALSAVAGLAAAAIIALAVVLATGSGNPAPTQLAGQEMTMTPVNDSPVQATATLVGKKWGTEITLHCHYAASSSGSGEQETYPPGNPPVFSLRVTDTHGAAHDLGSWSLPHDLDATFIGGTAVPPGQIQSVQILNADGTTVLTAAG
jgi:anti-sigma factor RsiW